MNINNLRNPRKKRETPTTNPFSKNYPMNNDKINGILDNIHLQNGISSNYKHQSIPKISNDVLDTNGPYQWSSPEIDDLFVSDPNVNISPKKPIIIEENIIALMEVNDIKKKCNKEIDDVYARNDIPFTNTNNVIIPKKNIITLITKSLPSDGGKRPGKIRIRTSKIRRIPSKIRRIPSKKSRRTSKIRRIPSKKSRRNGSKTKN